MKSRFLLIIAPAALLLAAGCSKSQNDKVADAAQSATTAVKNAAVDVKDATVDAWDNIKDFTLDRKADFSSGIDKMSKSMDDKIADLKASASSTTDSGKAKAVKDYDEARADLKAKLSDLDNATADTWASAKANVKTAWDKVKIAYDKAVN
jgi:CHASE3 domain sensor protein